jgi:hypothetical protein
MAAKESRIGGSTVGSIARRTLSLDHELQSTQHKSLIG